MDCFGKWPTDSSVHIIFMIPSFEEATHFTKYIAQLHDVSFQKIAARSEVYDGCRVSQHL